MIQEVVNILVVRDVLLVLHEYLMLFNMYVGEKFERIVWSILVVDALLRHG